jgi:hypothetical protein
MVWPDQAMMDALFGTDAVERVATGRLVLWLVFHVDGEAVGELAAIVGEDGVNGMGEVGEEALQEPGRGLGIPLGMDLQINVTCGAVDGDEGIAFQPFQRRQMLEIDMDEPDGGLFEDADSGLIRSGHAAHAMTLEASMDSAARQLAVHAAPHHLDDVVEWQLQPGSQFTDQRLFHRREAGLQTLRRVGMIADRSAAAPAADRGLADAEFGGQLRNRLPAALDVGPDLRSGGGVGVQIQFHDARRSLT